MEKKRFLTTSELAKILGISRIAVYKRIKSGKIKAKKIGRDFVVEKKDIGSILGKELTEQDKKEIEAAVGKVVEEYGETLRLLSKS